MNQNIAREIFDAISKTKLENLKLAVLKQAIAYSQIRAIWAISDLDTKIEMDSSRRISHNALIDNINILARNMHQQGESIEWFKHLKDNRIAIAEFACWVHNFLSLSA